MSTRKLSLWSALQGLVKRECAMTENVAGTAERSIRVLQGR